MSTTRRGFIGSMGAGFAALATGCAGRKLTDGGAEIPVVIRNVPNKLKEPLKEELSNRGMDVVNIERPERFDLRQAQRGKGNILRLSQRTSSWVRDCKVVAGNFFRHTWLSTECEDLGDVVKCTGYRCVGAKAMRFNSFEMGVAPVEVYTDPESDAFEAIMRAADSPEQRLSRGAMYGPVFMFTLMDGRQLEMFCGTKSMRHFATVLGSDHTYDGPCHLVSKEMTYRSFSWYVPVVVRGSHDTL